MSKIFWTPEKVSALSLQDVKNLLENAAAKSNEELVLLCNAELLSRKPKPKPKSIAGMPEGFVRVVRSERSKSKKLTSRIFLSSLLTGFHSDLISVRRRLALCRLATNGLFLINC